MSMFTLILDQIRHLLSAILVLVLFDNSFHDHKSTY